MESSTDSLQPKRSRAKKSVEAKPVTVTVKKKRTPKVAASDSPTVATEAAVTDVSITAANLDRAVVNVSERIALAAYFIAEKRGFVPGHDVDDWLSAEQIVRMELDSTAD